MKNIQKIIIFLIIIQVFQCNNFIKHTLFKQQDPKLTEEGLKIVEDTETWTQEEIDQMTLQKDPDFKHSCIHDKIVEQMEEQEKIEDKEIIEELNKLPKQEHETTLEWQPLRFHVNFDNIYNKGIPKKDIDFIIHKIIPAAKAYFETTFYVKRLKSPIIPSKKYTYYNYKCGETAIPQSLHNGVNNADMIMLINAQYASKENYLAYASKCNQYENELKDKRPTMGRFMINAYYLEKQMNTQRWFTWIETALHEMMHAMGFSSSQFSNFKDGNIGVNRQGQHFFMGKNAVQYGQKYFKCNKFNGLPLENNGGKGSVGSHWERIAFGNEGMTASDFGDAVFSEFTLNLLQDSGWYKYNSNNAQELSWGKGQGCTTMEGYCDKKSVDHNCRLNSKGCNFDYTSSGFCSQSDTFSPNCPIMSHYSNGSCTDENKSIMAKRSVNLGGSIGIQSRCWNVQKQSAYNSDIDAACYPSYCRDNILYVKIDEQWQKCYYEGYTIYGKHAVLECPNFDRFCLAEANCPNACSGQGTCINGVCQCYNGYKGTSCATAKKEKTTQKAGSSYSVNSSSGLTKSDIGSQQYCDVQRGDYLYKYTNGRYYCCNTQQGQCCNLYEIPYQGKCYCLTGYIYSSQENSCVKK